MDGHGFHEFVRSRLGTLSRIAYLLAGDHHAAQDLLQNALIKIATHWERVARAGEPMAYVRRVLYHEHVSGWRRDKHLRAEQSTESLPERSRGGDEAGEVVRRMVLEQALTRLTARQRALLVLRYFEDISEAETARILGIAVGSVKSQTSHALGRLRTLAPELADLVREPGVRGRD